MKYFITTLVAKIIYLISKTFKIGAGYTWAGHIALKICPNILEHRNFIFHKGLVLITGTNGKTTTTKLLTHFLTSHSYKTISNNSGANLLNGIVSHCILGTNLFGSFDYDYGVFEVDEFALPQVLKFLSPDILILLNLSRDQLDRYGEVDIIYNKWLVTLNELQTRPKVLFDSSTDIFRNILTEYRGAAHDFNLFSLNIETKDASVLFLSKFNKKNLKACLMTLDAFGLSFDTKSISSVLNGFSAAYGRGETISYEDIFFTLYLAKNPSSFNHNLEHILELTNNDSLTINNTALFIILNDNIPDGRDVSWIYDIEGPLLKSALSGFEIYISGTRRYDMAVRLTYAGLEISENNISLDILTSIKNIKNKYTNVIVLPNYSSMLQLRKLLTGKAIL